MLEHSPAEYRPAQGRGGAAVGHDPAHGVVHGRQHRDRLPARVDSEVAQCELADLRQALAQLGFSQVAQIEVHDLAMRPADRAAALLFVPVGLAQAVARTELHRLVARRGLGRPEAVVLQIAVASLVEQESPFAAAGLGKQQAGARHAGRVVLHELHVTQRHAVAVSSTANSWASSRLTKPTSAGKRKTSTPRSVTISGRAPPENPLLSALLPLASLPLAHPRLLVVLCTAFSRPACAVEGFPAARPALFVFREILREEVCSLEAA